MISKSQSFHNRFSHIVGNRACIIWLVLRCFYFNMVYSFTKKEYYQKFGIEYCLHQNFISSFLNLFLNFYSSYKIQCHVVLYQTFLKTFLLCSINEKLTALFPQLAYRSIKEDFLKFLKQVGSLTRFFK